MLTTDDLLRLAPISWQETADKMGPQERNEARQALEAISARAGMLAAYLDERHGSGCGDQGHAKALRQANRTQRAIRKAFGYQITHDLSV